MNREHTVRYYTRASRRIEALKPRFERKSIVELLSILHFLINSQSNNTGRGKLFCQPEEIAINSSSSWREGLNENRPERKRQNDQTKQEVIGVKRVEKNAKES